ncbi:hypothetical protein, conserved [Eimeria necatrix]|uniref:Uncharacterized protein n=1 Tax=Eimeria necatrix TaxID=51315 RepID=U6N270_9EIME|nr:hypothetical protein, conserved [Eimeria necatrix]CDJ70322.1 hypothetical protein, conserved [Eimeria necatrix]
MDLKTSAATEMSADAPCGYQLTDGLSEGPTAVSRQSLLNTPLPHVGRGYSSGLQFRWAKARPPFKAPFVLSWAILAYTLGIVAIIYFCRFPVKGGAQGSLRARRLASSNTDGLLSLCLELQGGELWTLPTTFDATSQSSSSTLLSPEDGSMRKLDAETYLDENTQKGAADASLKRPFQVIEGDQLSAPDAKVLKVSEALHVHQSLGLQESQLSDLYGHLLLDPSAEDFTATTCHHTYTVQSSGLPCADKVLLSGQQELMPLFTPELQPSSQDASEMWPAHITGTERYADLYATYEVEASHSTHQPGLDQHVGGAPSVYPQPVGKFQQQFDEDVLDQVALPRTMQATFQSETAPQEALHGAFSISSDQVNTPQQYTDTHGTHGRSPSEETLFISSEAEQQLPMQGSTMASYEVSQQRHDEHATSEDGYSSQAPANQIGEYELQLYLEESYTPSPGSANEPPQYTLVHDIREVNSSYPGLTPQLQSKQQLHARGSFTVRLEQGAGFSNGAELHGPQGFSGTQVQMVSTEGSKEKVSHYPHLAALLFGGDESSSIGEASHSFSSSTDLGVNDEKEEDPSASHGHCATLRKMLLEKPTGANTIDIGVAAHPFVRLPLLDSAVKLPPSSEPFPRCRTCPRFLARELLILRNIFQNRFIGLQQAKQIMRIASRLEFHARTFMVNEPPSRPSAAVEVLGRRFLTLNAIHSIKKVLGNQVQWDNWFLHLVRDVPTEYTQVPTTTTADFSVSLYSFAVELSAAMKMYRMGSAPSDGTVLRIKQKLFCSPKIPRCFRREEWAAFRYDDITEGKPCES